MTTMKKTAWITLLVFLVSWTTTFAQKKEADAKTPTEIATIQTNKMTTNYGLNDSQKSKVYAINVRTANQLEALKKNNKLNPTALQSKKAEIVNKQRADISSCLNQSQRTKFDQDNKAYDAKQTKH